MARILFCAVDGGAFNALLPVAALCTSQGYEVVWVTEVNKVAATLVTDGYFIEDFPDTMRALLRALKPDVVVAGVSGNGEDIALHLPQIAQDMGIPVVKVIDFWNTGMPHEHNFAPTRLCVLDEASRHIEVNGRQMLPKHVIATGGPQFDELLCVQSLPSIEISQTFGQPFFLVVGPSTKERVEELFDQLIPALDMFSHPFGLGVLWHPKSKKETYVDSIVKKLESRSNMWYIPDERLRKTASNNVLLASANLVIGTTSTELVKACYLKVPALSILPQDGENHEVLKSRGMFMLPTSFVKATWHAEDSKDAARFMQYVLKWKDPQAQDELALLRHAQMKHYKLDGNNALRVADVVWSLI